MRLDVLEHIKDLKENDDLINISELARRLNCDPRTISRYINNNSSTRKERDVKVKVEDYKDTIIEKVDKYGSSSMSIYKYIKKQGYSGGYHTVNNFINEYKEEKIKEATILFDDIPNYKAYINWDEKITINNKNYNLFVIVLGNTRLKFIELSEDKRQSTLKNLIVKGFKYFEKIPKEVVFDNISNIIDRKNSSFNELKIKRDFLDFSEKIGFNIITSEIYKPKFKEREDLIIALKKYLEIKKDIINTKDDLKNVVQEFNNDVNNIIIKNSYKIIDSKNLVKNINNLKIFQEM